MLGRNTSGWYHRGHRIQEELQQTRSATPLVQHQWHTSSHSYSERQLFYKAAAQSSFLTHHHL
ncbi:hypothetical protein Q9966_013788 [Columba livia]|nr:hypothetical protein Q9966_013788 [Columba livia]